MLNNSRNQDIKGMKEREGELSKKQKNKVEKIKGILGKRYES